MIAAAVQMTSTVDVEANLERAEHWIGQAASLGAELVCLPESFACMLEEGGRNPAAQPLDGPITAFLSAQAQGHGITLAGGTIPELEDGGERIYNTAVVHGPDGDLIGSYRKIHLFDVELPGLRLQESKSIAPGDRVVCLETPAGMLGLSVCYDIRFPELYRELSKRGAEVILVPSAFTVPTGSDHWEVLLRARAIENQSFVVAAAQFGSHNKKRRSYGRSMIIDPWGLVLATATDGEGLALARLERQRLEETRTRIPALDHRRLTD